MPGRDILFFYPHDFFEMSSGAHKRVHQLLGYLKARDFRIDMIVLDGYTNRWTPEHIADRTLFDSIEAVSWIPTFRDRFRLRNQAKKRDLPDLAITPLRKAVKRAMHKKYDFMVVNYAYWGGLADLAHPGTVKILDLLDFQTLINFQISGKQEFVFGNMFETEVRRISKFDYVLSISEEESITLNPFCPGTSFIDIPAFFPERRITESDNKEFDFIFIGSDNPFNVEGANWFMSEVHPLLDHSMKIAIVGKVCSALKSCPNMKLIPYADDLDKLYARTKAVMCPLKGGAGLKIKVVEALSYGRPVVTTSWGLKGILEKNANGCVLADDAADFAFAMKSVLEPVECKRLGQEGLSFFKRKYSEEACYAMLDRVFCSERP